MDKPWHETGTPPPPGGSWTFRDIPPPEKRPDHESYHALPGVSSSRLKLAAYGEKYDRPGPDGGMRDYFELHVARSRPAKEPSDAMAVGTMVDRLREAWPAIGDAGTLLEIADAVFAEEGAPEGWPSPMPSPLACGVIPTEATGKGGELQGRVATDLLTWAFGTAHVAGAGIAMAGDHNDPGHECAMAAWKEAEESGASLAVIASDPLAFTPPASEFGYAVIPGGKGKTDRVKAAKAEGLTPIDHDAWTSALDLAQRLWAEDPGAWADAPPPLIVPRKLWERALAAFRSVAEPETRQAEICKGLLLDGDGYGEYFAEWLERVEIREEDLVCPGCGGRVICDDALPDGRGWGCEVAIESVNAEIQSGRPGCLKCLLLDMDFETGAAVVEIHCRALLDRLVVLGGWPTIAEAKATEQPWPSDRRYSGFGWLARKFGYDQQVAFYSDGLRKAWGLPFRPPIVFAALGTGSRPEAWPHMMSPEDPDTAEKLRRADETNEAILYALALRFAGLRPWESDRAMSSEIAEL